MEQISIDKNTLTIKYADKYYSIVFDENTFKDCRVINQENIVDMLSNTDFTKFSLNSITDSLMVTINYVEQTRYMTITDSCIIECLLVDNCDKLLVHDKITKLEQQITELRLENESLKQQFNSIEMRILRHKLIVSKKSTMKNHYIYDKILRHKNNYINEQHPYYNILKHLLTYRGIDWKPLILDYSQSKVWDILIFLKLIPELSPTQYIDVTLTEDKINSNLEHINQHYFNLGDELIYVTQYYNKILVYEIVD